MKKTICILLAATLAVTAFAQAESQTSVYASPDGRIALDVVSRLGWGFGFVKSDEFEPKGSGEFFFNMLNLKVYPVPAFGLELGADMGVRYIGSRENAFVQHDHIIDAVDFSTISDSDRARSSINILSINVPLLAKFRMDKFQIGGGVEAQINLTGNSRYSYREQDTRVEAITYRGKINTLTYGFVGIIGISSVSVFAKFYPKRFLPNESVNFSFWTLGVALGL